MGAVYRFYVSEAMGWERLGAPARAVALYRAELGDESDLARNRICTHSYLAAALLDEGDVTLAIAEGRRALSSFAAARMTSARPVSALRPVRMAAESAGDEEFCAHFDAADRALTAA